MTPGVFACCGLVGGWGHAEICAHFLPRGRPSGSVDRRPGFVSESLTKSSNNGRTLDALIGG